MSPRLDLEPRARRQINFHPRSEPDHAETRAPHGRVTLGDLTDDPAGDQPCDLTHQHPCPILHEHANAHGFVIFTGLIQTGVKKLSRPVQLISAPCRPPGTGSHGPEDAHEYAHPEGFAPDPSSFSISSTPSHPAIGGAYHQMLSGRRDTFRIAEKIEAEGGQHPERQPVPATGNTAAARDPSAPPSQAAPSQHQVRNREKNNIIGTTWRELRFLCRGSVNLLAG